MFAMVSKTAMSGLVVPSHAAVTGVKKLGLSTDLTLIVISSPLISIFEVVVPFTCPPAYTRIYCLPAVTFQDVPKLYVASTICSAVNLSVSSFSSIFLTLSATEINVAVSFRLVNLYALSRFALISIVAPSETSSSGSL